MYPKKIMQNTLIDTRRTPAVSIGGSIQGLTQHATLDQVVFKNDGFCIQNDAFCIQTDGFIQVIPTIYRSRRGLTVKTYKYSVTSAEHTDTDKFPSAKFTYQISPMAVVMTEKGEPLYEFLTRLCAIVGGL